MDRLRGAPTITGPTREAEIFLAVRLTTSASPNCPCFAYCTAVNLSRWYAHEINEGDYRRHWLDATKLVALLASRLRLAPSTRLDKGKVEREVVGDAPRPWE